MKISTPLRPLRLLGVAASLLSFGAAHTFGQSSTASLRTRYSSVALGPSGEIISLKSQSGTQYVPHGHPSALLTLQINGSLVAPERAEYHNTPAGLQIMLHYPGGVSATVAAIAKQQYLRFQLQSVAPRHNVDSVVWGPLATTITGRMGDLIGVVRSSSWAIGMVGLDDNTIGGPPSESDFFQMGYYIHSTDPVNHPVPSPFKEGQRLGVGGDGKNDVAFFSHPEEYFQFVVGSAARVEPGVGSSIAYHSRDRRKPYTFLFSLLPDFPDSTPRHQITDAVNADYIGSSVALYSCPDTEALKVIEGIEMAEGLPHITRDGIWIRDPRAEKPDMAWYGPHDKLVEYANALGLKAVQDEELGEYYPNPADRWAGKRVNFRNGKSLSIREYTDTLAKENILYGLHTLCCFIQPHSSDVHPVPNPHLQTVVRTKLAGAVTAADTELTVTEASYLAEPGTWHGGPNESVLRIGTELLTYKGISSVAPFTLTGVKRGQYGTKASVHGAGEEVAKLQMNCYHGFVPDMTLLPEYADYYAALLNDGGMQYIDFDGLESVLYQNQGYYAVRTFFRRLFDTYQKLSGGKYLRVMASATFPGGWEYESVGNVGGGRQNFDPVNNRWGIEGKDIRNGYENSYYPGTFGIQNYASDWSVYDAENLQAKSIGWGCTYMLGLSEDAVERSGEKQEIFKQYRLWEDARAAGYFTPTRKAALQNMERKFHLERAGSSFVVRPVAELKASGTAGSGTLTISSPYGSQFLQMDMKMLADVDSVELILPDGTPLQVKTPMKKGQRIVINKGRASIADANRKHLTELQINIAPALPKGQSTVQYRCSAPAEVTIWAMGDRLK